MFFVLCQRGSSCWKYRKWCSYFKNRYHHTKMVEKKTINVLVSPYCTLLFSRKENIKFSGVVLVAVHCNCLISYLMIAWIWALKYYQYYSGYLLACGKRQLKHWTYYQLTRTIDCRLISVFKKNLEHLSHHILVLLFKFLTGKCWLAPLAFCQTNTVISTYTYKTLHRLK